MNNFIQKLAKMYRKFNTFSRQFAYWDTDSLTQGKFKYCFILSQSLIAQRAVFESSMEVRGSKFIRIEWLMETSNSIPES